MTAQPPESTGPGSAAEPTDARRSQAAVQPGTAPEETISRRAEAARAKVAELGVSQADVADAIRWARSTEPPSG